MNWEYLQPHCVPGPWLVSLAGDALEQGLGGRTWERGSLAGMGGANRHSTSPEEGRSITGQLV